MTLHQPVHHLSPSVQPKGPDRTLIMPDGQTQVNSQRRARHGLAARLRRPGVRLLGLLLGCFGCVACTGGDDDKAANWVRDWHAVALHAIALDHTPVASGDPRVFGEQLGPLRTSRALAITHIAIFDVVNAIVGRYQSYTRLPPAPPDTSLKAAIAQAAHDTLVALFPSQAASLNERLRTSLAALQDRTGAAAGIELGQRAARAILAQRARDGAQHEEPRVGIEFLPGTAPGLWRPDPLSQGRLALGARWSEVTPFVLQSAAQFRLGPPPALTSPEYAAAFHEVQRLGGDGLLTPTLRTLEETVIGLFWAYDGTPGLGPPPRLYNQIALIIATQQGADVVQLARVLALVNVAMADAGIALWDSKYYYQYWRPVTGIREADPGTGPTLAGDGNRATVGDTTFTPLGAPASNLQGPNFTPPFPAYPSGHAGFGGALFQILRQMYGTDQIAFSVVSDELNGSTQDNLGNVRPRLPRHFHSLTEAEEENGQSRIYLGIHWAFDKTEGMAQGRRVADYVFRHAFVPVP